MEMKRVQNGESGLSVFVKAVAFSPIILMFLFMPMLLALSNMAKQFHLEIVAVFLIPVILYMSFRIFLNPISKKDGFLLDWNLKLKELTNSDKEALKRVDVSNSYQTKWIMLIRIFIWFIFVTNVAPYGLAYDTYNITASSDTGIGEIYATMFGAIVMIFAYYNLKRLIQWKLEVRRIKAESKKENDSL